MPTNAAGDEASDLDAALTDRDWTVLPAGTRHSSFAAPSGVLAVASLGDPQHPRVVLIPGATGSKEDFVLLAPLLVDAGYFVQSYDLAGQYQSAAAGQGRPYDYELFVVDLIRFLESATVPVHVLGYSFAGIVAQLAFARRPELFASMAMLSVPPQPGQSFRGVRWIGPLSRFPTPRVIAGLMIWGIVTNKNKVLPGRLDLARMRFDFTDRRSVNEIMGLMKRVPDHRKDLAASGIPLLVAVGERDLWPLVAHRDFAEAIGARVSVYRTGHSPCETTPHQLARDLLALYSRA